MKHDLWYDLFPKDAPLPNPWWQEPLPLGLIVYATALVLTLIGSQCGWF